MEKRGFTFIELLVVCAILTCIVVIVVQKVKENGQQKEQNMNQVLPEK